MRRDSGMTIVGFDIRKEIDLISKKTLHRMAKSFDPNLWPSLQEENAVLFCNLYGVGVVSDVTNGINLAEQLPDKKLPDGYVLAAFEAPIKIVEYMSKSFALNYSSATSVFEKERFEFVGYDVVDLWTQSTNLQGPEGVLDISSQDEIFQLLKNIEEAKMWAAAADEIYPGQFPHQPLGIYKQQT